MDYTCQLVRLGTMFLISTLPYGCKLGWQRNKLLQTLEGRSEQKHYTWKVIAFQDTELTITEMLIVFHLNSCSWLYSQLIISSSGIAGPGAPPGAWLQTNRGSTRIEGIAYPRLKHKLFLCNFILFCWCTLFLCFSYTLQLVHSSPCFRWTD